MMRLALITIFLAALVARSDAQTVIHDRDTGKSLSERWDWAIHQAQTRDFPDGYWVGYSIERLMGERSFIGSFSSDEARNRPSLLEVITGMKPEVRLDTRSGHEPDEPGHVTDEGAEERPESRVVKEVAILFHILSGGKQECDALKVSNLSLHVDLEGYPVVWLGSARQQESVGFLESRYAASASTRVRKSIIMAVGLHGEVKSSIEFLRKILLGSEAPEIRKESAFWLSQTQADEARTILVQAAKEDRAETVREEAIFGLSQLHGEASVDALIQLAKELQDREMRKKAIFWISQKASKKAVRALSSFVEKDHDTEVQRNALFALTQMDGNGGLDKLISVAKTHPNPRIRKEAIFWLGQSDDPRALAALVDIVKE